MHAISRSVEENRLRGVLVTYDEIEKKIPPIKTSRPNIFQ